MTNENLNLLVGKENIDELANKQIEPIDSFYFIQGADSQFGFIDSYIKKLPEPKWDEEIRLNELFVSACNKLEPKPKFVIICGDLIDAWPGTELKRLQLIDFVRIYSKLDPSIALVCVCGNHDIGNQPTLATIEEYKEKFRRDYFYFVINNVLFIVINSQFYENREFVEDYAKEHDDWLDKILSKCRQYKQVILFQHIPWFLNEFDEDDEYFNINRDIRLVWLKKLHDAGIKKIFCGHYHRNAGGWYKDMEQVVTSAIGGQCGDDKSGARIVKVSEDNIEHEYYALEEFPQTVDL